MFPYIIMGLFAFVIAIVSLWRIMAEKEFYRLTMMKRAFGRRRGLAVHFTITVAIPVVLGIVFLSGGVTGKSWQHPLQPSGSSMPTLHEVPDQPLPHDYICFA